MPEENLRSARLLHRLLIGACAMAAVFALSAGVRGRYANAIREVDQCSC